MPVPTSNQLASYSNFKLYSLVFPQCIVKTAGVLGTKRYYALVHDARRHMVVRLCVSLSVRQILHIFMSGELQVLKVGQYDINF